MAVTPSQPLALASPAGETIPHVDLHLMLEGGLGREMVEAEDAVKAAEEVEQQWLAVAVASDFEGLCL